MDAIIQYAFESGAVNNLNNIIFSVLFIWIMFFVTKHWWPDRVKRMNVQQEIDRDLKMKEIEADLEIRKLELDAQIDIYQQVVKDMGSLKLSVDGLRATFNDFLQNILSQFIEDRRDLIDSQVFRSKDRKS